MKVLLLTLALIVTVSGRQIKFDDCGNGEVKSVDVDPCDKEPCQFKKGQQVTMTAVAVASKCFLNIRLSFLNPFFFVPESLLLRSWILAFQQTLIPTVEHWRLQLNLEVLRSSIQELNPTFARLFPVPSRKVRSTRSNTNLLLKTTSPTWRPGWSGMSKVTMDACYVPHQSLALNLLFDESWFWFLTNESNDFFLPWIKYVFIVHK